MIIRQLNRNKFDAQTKEDIFLRYYEKSKGKVCIYQKRLSRYINFSEQLKTNDKIYNKCIRGILYNALKNDFHPCDHFAIKI